jgi:hypothetical protein
VGYDELQIYTNNNTVMNNTIGLDVNMAPLPNQINGVSIGRYGTQYSGGFAMHNVVGPNNIIAHNGRHGVMIWEHPRNSANCDQNTITQNSIYSNAILGIDLDDDTVTANDALDPDSIANQDLNFPVITYANFNGVQTTINGTIDIDTDPLQAAVEVFSAVQNLFYSNGQGSYYLGMATPDAAGNWTLTTNDTMANYHKILTATTTDQYGNTSEFSDNYAVTGAIRAHGIKTHDSHIRLLPHYPNPVSGSVVFRFYLPEPRSVSITVFNVTGSVVEELEAGQLAMGLHSIAWNGCDAEGHRLGPGTYFYRFKTGTFETTRKLLNLK